MSLRGPVLFVEEESGFDLDNRFVEVGRDLNKQDF